MRDTSKPANGTEAGQELLYRTGGMAGNSFFRSGSDSPIEVCIQLG
jgi:hypothetical protein